MTLTILFSQNRIGGAITGKIHTISIKCHLMIYAQVFYKNNTHKEQYPL